MDRNSNSVSRRQFNWNMGQGFAGLAMADMLARDGFASNGLVQPQGKVKRVIQLFMTGGASQIDTYDYKPALEKYHGQSLGPKEKPEGFTAPAGSVMKSPFRFAQHGQSGRWVSEVFPEQARHVDDMAFLMSMASKTNVHGPGTYMMNSGFLFPGFPCMGAWISYALGQIADDMPAFVVLPDARGLPYNQNGCFSSGFLPSVHQGMVLPAKNLSQIPNLFPNSKYGFADRTSSEDGLQLLAQLNRDYGSTRSDDSRLDARIKSYELAAKMQMSAPEALDIESETARTKSDYGLDQPATEDFGRRCLLARRLIERGVRFVQVWSGPQGATNNWDNHGNIPAELPPMAASVDRPIATLLTDLKSRGLDSDTLVIWTTEFGRTPFAQGGVGRDHNGGTFVTWLWGAGVRKGVSIGASDELGYQAVEKRMYCYDLHATVLHLLGLDHEKLTYRQNGIDRRLTDVHGNVIREVLDAVV